MGCSTSPPIYSATEPPAGKRTLIKYEQSARLKRQRNRDMRAERREELEALRNSRSQPSVYKGPAKVRNSLNCSICNGPLADRPLLQLQYGGIRLIDLAPCFTATFNSQRREPTVLTPLRSSLIHLLSQT